MLRKALATTLALFALILLLASPGFAADTRAFAPAQDGFATQAPEVATYAADRVLVQLTRDGLAASRLSQLLDKGARAPGAATGLASLDALAAAAGVRAVERPYDLPGDVAKAADLGVDRWFMFRFETKQDMADVAKTLGRDPSVEAVSLDWVAFPAAVPADPLYVNHWGHNNTAQLPGLDWGGTYDHTLTTTVGTVGFDANAQVAWDGSQGYGSSSVVVAIIDSGVDIDHPDLRLVTGYDFGSNDTNPDDNSTTAGHGTCCAGVVASMNNTIGCAGIAAGVSIMPLKVATSTGAMYFSAIQSALYYAADHAADVVSMSLGAAISSDAATDTAILYAYNAGCTILAATGNENMSTISYPAINANVIGVGAASPCGERKRSSSSSTEVNSGVATDPNGYTCDGERWWGSNYGTTTQNGAGAVDVLGPTILPTTDIVGSGGYRTGDYEPFFNGTSCATPYVAGVCALIVSKNPTWTPAQIRTQLLTTAQDVTSVESAAGWDRYAGFGMVDAAAAVGGVTIPVAPVANFSATPLTGAAPLAVVFTDLSTNTPTSWSWNFGDSGTSTLKSPSHTYAAAGTYTVTLTATNSAGSDGETKTGYIVVTTSSGTWTTITSDNFETGMGTYTDGGLDMLRYTATVNAHQGAAAADIQDNSGTKSSFYHTAGKNVTGYSNLEVNFWFKAVGMETGEDFWVQYYDGAAWRTVATYKSGTDFVNSTFYNKTVTISRATYAYPTAAKLRFMCDASADDDDVYIDEIVFRGYTAALAAAPADEAAADKALPIPFALGQNRPNPFNPSTTFEFSLPADTRVLVRVFDLKGRAVATLADGQYGAGSHSVRWDATEFASGTYFYRIDAGERSSVRKMTLLK
ncbi:MAG: S8 family serine peptidase [bacterium]|nr:S8 family serine peptidase [bacterium]